MVPSSMFSSNMHSEQASKDRGLNALPCPPSREIPGRWKVSVRDVVVLVVVTLIAACIRFDFLAATKFVIDADEAIVGLMAKHIVEGGHLPVFYYGQHYMGSLEAILVAGMFSVFGISEWALQSVPFLFAVALTPVIFLLTRELGGRAAAHFAAILYALPPAGLLVWSSKARGGFIEVVFLGALALLYACRWLRSEKLDRALIAKIGFLLGVGWWVNNQIVYFMVPIALCMAMKGVRAAFGSGSMAVTGRVLSQYVTGAIVGTVCFLIGSSPYWIYNIQHGFPSLGMFGFATVEDIGLQAIGLFSTAIPILLGSKRFWDAAPGLGAFSMAYLVVYGVLAALLIRYRWRNVLQLGIAKIDRERPVEMLTVFIVVSCTVFTVSTFGWLVQAPRYLLPVYVGLFPLCAVVVESLGIARRGVAITALITLVLMNIIPAYFPTRALQGEPVVFKGERVDKDHSKLIARLTNLGISRVRTNYWIGYRLAFETNEKITFVVFQEPRTVRMPEYEFGLLADDRDALPLVVVPSEAIMVRIALRRLGYSFSEERIGGYFLIFDIRRESPPLVRIAPTHITVSSNVGSIPPTQVLDDDLSTRWGTGTHQVPGQELRFSFTAPTPIAAMQLESGQWTHDYPRGLAIVAINERGEEVVLISPKDYAAVRYFAAENGEVKFVFTPISVRELIVRQTGTHGIFDWSLAEVKIFTTGKVPHAQITQKGM